MLGCEVIVDHAIPELQSRLNDSRGGGWRLNPLPSASDLLAVHRDQ